MNKLFSYLLCGSLFLAACTDTGNDNNLTSRESTQLSPAKRDCAAMDVLEMQLAADPKLAGRMASIEEHTRAFIAKGKPSGATIVIPVIVNVIYNTASENISLEQIESQIDVLNDDFNAANSDLSQVPDLFEGVVGDFGIEFTLAGVVRKYSSKTSWGLNDNMKFSKRGGIDATDPEHKLNMWVVNNLAQGPYIYLGYAQFPGGNPATDGVVIGHNYFGDTGEVLAPYDKGRTATHEVGHWLNLRHIWGDANCGNDFVGDTPLHDTYNFGCPEFPHLSTCAGTPVEMTMNYMDYTEDLCMYMFTEGQRVRSLAVFDTDGPRASFLTN